MGPISSDLSYIYLHDENPLKHTWYCVKLKEKVFRITSNTISTTTTGLNNRIKFLFSKRKQEMYFSYSLKLDWISTKDHVTSSRNWLYDIKRFTLDSHLTIYRTDRVNRQLKSSPEGTHETTKPPQMGGILTKGHLSGGLWHETVLYPPGVYLMCVSQVSWLTGLMSCTCQWKLKASSSCILPSLEGTQSGGAGCTISEPSVTSPNTNRALMANQPPNLGCTHTPNIFCREQRFKAEVRRQEWKRLSQLLVFNQTAFIFLINE